MKYEQSGTQGWTQLFSTCVSSALDLMAVLFYVAIADVLVLEAGLGPVARTVLGLPLVVLLPGYALTAALFPRSVNLSKAGQPHRPFEAATAGALTSMERLALSFGASLAVLPLIGSGNAVWNLGYSASALLGPLNTFVALSLFVAVVRRLRVPHRERITFAPRSWPTRVRGVFTNQSRTDTLLTVGLVFLVVVATSSLALALIAPTDGESYTTIELLTENESGDLVTDGYPTNFTAGESRSLVLGIENHEGEEMAYTVVTELQRVQRTNTSATVTEDRELARQRQTLAANETWHATQSVEPTMTGDRLRLAYLLYRGEPPADTTIENAYRHVHIWVSVDDA